TREIASTLVPVKLSAIESKLLKLFCEAEDGIVYRDAALKQIWEDENSFRERSLNVYVSKLRQYMKDDPNIEILNIHGTGYKLVVR
nr:helix-turn-helix domain-containing protein [Saprospiraceae bacterium]